MWSSEGWRTSRSAKPAAAARARERHLRGDPDGARPGPAMTGAVDGTSISSSPSTISSARCSSIRSCYEAQRVLGELYLALSPGDPKARREGRGKFNYANDLAPDDLASLRAAAIVGGGRQARGRARAVPQAGDDAAVGSRRALPARRGDVAHRRRRRRRAPARAGHRARARSPRGASRARADPRVAQRHGEAGHRARGDRDARAGRSRGQGRPRDRLRRARQVGQVDRGARGDRRGARARSRAAGPDRRRPPPARHDLDGALAWYARAGKLAPESSLPGFAARRRSSMPASSPTHRRRTRTSRSTRPTSPPPRRRSARSR